MLKVGALAEEFYANILYDEEPLFVSEGEVLERCSTYYGVPVSFAESQQPLFTRNTRPAAKVFTEEFVRPRSALH